MPIDRSLTDLLNLPIMLFDGVMKAPVAEKNSGVQYAMNQ
jgi:hypothetical protein